MKKRMLTCMIIISLLSIATLAQSNQEETSLRKEKESDLRTGNKALLFTFNGLDIIKTGNFEGGMGGKLFLNKNLNLRVGIEFNLVNETIPAAQEGFQDGTKTAIAFGVNLAAEYHLTSGRISPYLGLGTGINVLTTTSEHTPNQNEERTNMPEEIDGTLYNPGIDISLSVLAGVEFFLIKNLSLATEYRIGFTNHSNLDGEVKSNGNTVQAEGSNIFNASIENQGWLTLAFYF